LPNLGFLVSMDAKRGRESDVTEFLADAKDLVDSEPGTVAWFAFRTGPTTFAIFDAFKTENDRQVHLHGRVRTELEARAEELFSAPPVITPVDVLACKWPVGQHRVDDRPAEPSPERSAT
jgi:hypothetical protein